MHQEFAVKGCNDMTLVDRVGDTTKYCVVYRYVCAFHNYIKCPFLVRIRVLVLSVSLLSVSLALSLHNPTTPHSTCLLCVWHAGTGGVPHKGGCRPTCPVTRRA